MKLFKITKKNNIYDLKVGGGVTLNSKPILAIPVGFICLLSCDTSPAELFGGVWERISQGRAIYGAGSLNGIEYLANKTKDAGLPNIAGFFTAKTYSAAAGISSGSFRDIHVNPDAVTPSGTNKDRNQYIPFNASDGECGITRISVSNGEPTTPSYSNKVYGKSTTVQPDAYICNVWKKIE